MVTVRPFNSADVTRVATIQTTHLTQDRRVAFSALPGTLNEILNLLETWPARHPHGAFLVAQEDEGVVGYVMVVAHPDSGLGELQELVVGRPWRRQGHDRALLRAGAPALLDRGMWQAELTTVAGDPARPWYVALGGQQVATIPDTPPIARAGEVIVYLWPEIRELLSALA